MTNLKNIDGNSKFWDKKVSGIVNDYYSFHILLCRNQMALSCMSKFFHLRKHQVAIFTGIQILIL